MMWWSCVLLFVAVYGRPDENQHSEYANSDAAASALSSSTDERSGHTQLYPHYNLKSVNGRECHRPGEMFNVVQRNVYYVCICVPNENGNLVPKCSPCNRCRQRAIKVQRVISPPTKVPVVVREFTTPVLYPAEPSPPILVPSPPILVPSPAGPVPYHPVSVPSHPVPVAYSPDRLYISGKDGHLADTESRLSFHNPVPVPSLFKPAPYPSYPSRPIPVPSPAGPMPSPFNPVPSPPVHVPYPYNPEPYPPVPVPSPPEPVPSPFNPVPSPPVHVPSPYNPEPYPPMPVPSPPEPVPFPYNPVPVPSPFNPISSPPVPVPSPFNPVPSPSVYVPSRPIPVPSPGNRYISGSDGPVIVPVAGSTGIEYIGRRSDASSEATSSVEPRGLGDTLEWIRSHPSDQEDHTENDVLSEHGALQSYSQSSAQADAVANTGLPESGLQELGNNPSRLGNAAANVGLLGFFKLGGSGNRQKSAQANAVANALITKYGSLVGLRSGDSTAADATANVRLSGYRVHLGPVFGKNVHDMEHRTAALSNELAANNRLDEDLSNTRLEEYGDAAAQTHTAANVLLTRYGGLGNLHSSGSHVLGGGLSSYRAGILGAGIKGESNFGADLLIKDKTQ